MDEGTGEIHPIAHLLSDKLVQCTFPTTAGFSIRTPVTEPAEGTALYWFTTNASSQWSTVATATYKFFLAPKTDTQERGACKPCETDDCIFD